MKFLGLDLIICEFDHKWKNKILPKYIHCLLAWQFLMIIASIFKLEVLNKYLIKYVKNF